MNYGERRKHLRPEPDTHNSHNHLNTNLLAYVQRSLIAMLSARDPPFEHPFTDCQQLGYSTGTTPLTQSKTIGEERKRECHREVTDNKRK